MQQCLDKYIQFLKQWVILHWSYFVVKVNLHKKMWKDSLNSYTQTIFISPAITLGMLWFSSINVTVTLVNVWKSLADGWDPQKKNSFRFFLSNICILIYSLILNKTYSFTSLFKKKNCIYYIFIDIIIICNYPLTWHRPVYESDNYFIGQFLMNEKKNEIFVPGYYFWFKQLVVNK